MYSQAETHFRQALERAQQLDNAAIREDIERGLAEAVVKQQGEDNTAV
jgi:hypothetical protein